MELGRDLPSDRELVSEATSPAAANWVPKEDPELDPVSWPSMLAGDLVAYISVTSSLLLDRRLLDPLDEFFLYKRRAARSISLAFCSACSVSLFLT